MDPQPGSALKGKTALLTGATGLIGRAIARSLAESGVSLVLHYNRSRDRIEELRQELTGTGCSCHIVQADFQQIESGAPLIESAVELAGKIDFLINSASLFTESTLDTVTWGDFRDNMQVNAWVPLVLGRAFRSICRKGAIVNLLDSRISGYDPIHAGYIVSKHALAALTRIMAKEFAPQVTVNAVAPGLLSLEAGADELRAMNLPLKKAVEPSAVAETVLFLLNSPSVTGETINIDGGRHLR